MTWQVQTEILGKMTPCLQLVDTDLDKLYKDILYSVKEDIRRDLQAKAEREGKAPSFKMEAYDLIKLLHRSSRCS